MDIFQEQLKQQIEGGSFSKEFTVYPAGGGEPFVIRGIFDESVVIDEGKRGTKPVPRIIVFKAPDYVSGETKVTVEGKTYRMQKHEVDANTGTVVFLSRDYG